MAQAAAARVPFLLLRAWLSGAFWAPLSEVAARQRVGAVARRVWGPPAGAVVEALRLDPLQGCDRTSLGNLEGAASLGDKLQAARTHALVDPMGVGVPPQALACLIDAASAAPWLSSMRCAGRGADMEERGDFFGPRRSDSFEPLTCAATAGSMALALHAHHGGGSAFGFIASDTGALACAAVARHALVQAREVGGDAHRERTWVGVRDLWRLIPQGAVAALQAWLPGCTSGSSSPWHLWA